MILKMTLPAPDGGRFARDAFDHQIGGPIKFAGKKATLRDAKVSFGGQKVVLTIDAPLVDLTEYT